MSATLEDLPPPPRRSTRRRMLVYSALGLIALIIIAVLLALLYLRSEKFNRFVATEIEKALEDYGLLAEIGDLKMGRGFRTVTLRNVKLFNRQTGQLIATIERATVSITIRDPFALKLRREIALDRLEITGVDLRVVFDEQGQSNFQGLRRAPPSDRRITFDYSRLVGSLVNSKLLFIDRKHGVHGDLRDLSGEAQPIEGSDPPKVGAQLTAGAGYLSRDGREMAIEAVEFIGRVMESGAEIERLALRSPAAEVTASGRLDDWLALRYQLDTQARVKLEEAFAFFAPNLSIKGVASFNGRVEGEGARWNATGMIRSNELAASGVTFRDAQAEKARLDSQDGRWTFSIGQTKARSIVAEGIEFTNATASKLSGTVINGRAQGAVDQATVARVKIARSEFNEITLRDVGMAFGSDKRKKPPTTENGRWTFSSALAQARSGVVEGIEFTNATASKLSGMVVNGRAQAAADQARVERVKTARNEFNEITLREIGTTFESGASKGAPAYLNGRWTFSSALAQARSGTVEGTEFTGASASKLSGTVVSGRAQITADQATVGRAKDGQSEFNEITLRDVGVTIGSGVGKRAPGHLDGQWTFSSALAQARSIVVEGVELTNASASKVNVTSVAGRAQITSGQATVERVKTGQNEFNEITARDISATLESSAGKGLLDGQWKFSIGQTEAGSGAAEEVIFTKASAANLSGTIVGGRAQITSGQATVERAEARLGVFNEITLRDINVTLASVRQGASEARGLISLRDGSWDKIKFGQTTGRFAVNRNEISLSGFNTSALGGGVSGDLTVGLSPNGSSKLRVEFTGAQTAELFSSLGVRNDHLVGTVTGRADVTWPGTNLRLISGDISARFDGQTTSTPDAIPVKGEIVARAQDGVFYFDPLTLRTDASTLNATGKLALDGDSDLRFSLTSTRAEELQTILNSPGLVTGQVARLLKTYEPQVFGDFSFTGTLTGRLDNPAITGDLQASSFGLRDEVLGALKGRVLISPSEFRFEQGSITTDAGGSATINFVTTYDAAATDGSLDITFERINLDTMLSAMGLPTQQKLASGEVSGEAHLTGLPAAPRGDVSLNLSNGVIAGQRAESATAMIRFDGQMALIERVEARLPQGRFTASGVVNLQTNEYQFQGQAEQLGLQRVAEALELSAARISGVADATFQVSGDFDNPENFKIEMTAQARQVTVNGRETGPVTLTARTTPDGRVDVELTTGVAGSQQPLTASIEWRRTGRPIVIRANLENFDISPVLSVYAPEIARSIAGQVSGTLRIAGPLINAQGEATIAGLRGALLLTNVSLEVLGTPVSVSTPLEITIGDSQIRIESARITAQGADLRVGGSLAITESAPINFSIEGQVNLNAFDRPDDGIDFDGEAVVNARIGGAFNDPRLTGEAILRDISVSSPASPITIEEGSGRITLSGDRLTLENFTARAGDGVVRINGGVTIAQFKPSEWRFDIIADNADVLWRGIRATADANLTLTGAPQAQRLSGVITIPQGDFTSDFSLTELGGSGRLRIGGVGGGGITASGGAFSPISLDIHVEAFDSFVIRNNQVNTIASATLNITGTLEDPDVIGRVTFEGGTITFRGRRYDITVGTLDLPGGTAEEPRLQVLAESNISGYRVYVGFNGPTGNLNITLRSEPDLPRAEIISLITTGRADAAAQIGADPALSGLSTAASLFSEEFFSKPLEREAQRILGINRFQIEPVLRPYTNPAARLTIGRQLAHGLTFIYSTNLATNQDQTGLVEYDINKNFSILAAYTQSGNIQIQGPEENIFTIEVRGRKNFSLGVTPPPTTGAAITSNLSRRALPAADLRLSLSAPGPKEVEISRKRLRELLPVMTEGFSRARMRLGERNLANYLQEKGYFFAEVKARCEPADCKATDSAGPRVFYDVRTGARYKLKDIRITGAEELNKHELAADLESKEKSLLGGVPLLENLPFVGGGAHGVTSNDRLRVDRETIRERLMNMGYRSARVESRLAVDPDDDDLVVIFDVVKGPRSIVDDIVIRGNTMVEAPLLGALTPVKRGDFFLYDKAREGANQIRDFYTERGYLDARTEVSLLDLSDNRVRLIYDVNEGARAIALQIVVTGQTITREESIRRFFDFKTGEVLTPKPLRDAVRDLYATGAFREVIIRTDPIAGADVDARRVSVNVIESKPLQMYYGLGYSTDSGPRGTLQLTNTNLFGRIISGSARLLISQTDQLAQLSLTDLRPWGTKWPTTISAFYNRDSNLRPFVRRRLVDPNAQPNNVGQSFGVNRFVGFVQTERKLSDLMALRFRYSFENAKLFNLENIPEIEVTRNERAIRLGVFSVGFTRETRDNALWPTNGQLFSFDYGLAARSLGGNESYNKFFGMYQRYDTPRGLGGVTFAMAARVGLADLFAVSDRDHDGIITEPERRLPISERFFAGGATTLRGFRFEQAGPQGILEPRNPNELPTLVPIGGDALVILNFELHYPLTRRLRLVPFYDLGNVFRRVSDINFAGMTNSVGVGLRFNTPIGPVGVDYGFLLDPPSFVTASGAVLRQPSGAFQFRIGQTF